tara:strand:- start:902 stop:1657 length:756 start_codon:yes stop_codon:yes gene_type:complete
MSNIIQSLWIGGDLSKMEQLSIQSFLDNNHEYHLYVYDNVNNVPKGTIIKDANEILNKNEIFRYKNGSVSAFSNLFRFTMLYKKGGYWADTDLICLKPFHHNQDFVIATETNTQYNKDIITSCFLKMPINSQEALEGIRIQRINKFKILSGEMQWGSGPSCVKSIVEKFNLQKYLLKWNAVCSCSWSHFDSFLNSNYIKPNKKIINKFNEIPENMVAIHLWNEIWRRNNLDKNKNYDPNCFYELLKKKHNI